MTISANAVLMRDPNTSNSQIPQPNNKMVRLSNIQGKVLRRLKEQAGTKEVKKYRSTEVVGKPVYLYVNQKFPERHINPTHTTTNARPAQLHTPTNLPKEFG
jgi:hypothetical protein